MAEAGGSSDGVPAASSSSLVPADEAQQQLRQQPATSAGAGSSSGIDAPLQPVLQNIVATCNLAVELDLKTIAMKARNAEYNPKRFAAVIMRIRDPKTTALIFKSGKMVVTGAKSEEQARNAARKYARIIQKMEFPVQFTEFKIQNIVGSCDVRFPIRLEGLAYKHSHYSSYEPELFPGLIYRMVQPKIVLLIFVSGKVVLTGGKVRKEIYDAFDQIYPVLQGASNQILTRTPFARPRVHRGYNSLLRGDTFESHSGRVPQSR